MKLMRPLYTVEMKLSLESDDPLQLIFISYPLSLLFILSWIYFMHWRRRWQPTPVFLPGESQRRRSWWAAIYGVAQSWTRLKRLSSSSRDGIGSNMGYMGPVVKVRETGYNSESFEKTGPIQTLWRIVRSKEVLVRRFLKKLKLKSRNPALGRISRENCNSKRHMLPSVHCSTTDNSQDMKAT